MTTLEKIVKQDAVVAEASIVLNNLKNKYVSENRKYPDKYFVQFNDFGKPKIGRIQRARYNETHNSVGVQYAILVVNQSGSYSNRDKAFYYKFEKEVKPHPILNAMNGL